MIIDKIENGYIVTLEGEKYPDRKKHSFPTWEEVLTFITDKAPVKKSLDY
jgi:hypothetical protein